MVLRDSPFGSGSPTGNGAEKRSFQINYLLAKAGFKIDDLLENKYPQHSGNYLKRVLKIPKKYLVKSIWSTSFSEARKKLKYYENRELFISNYKDLDVDFFLWERTTPKRFYSVNAANKLGFSIISIPHNIESLVPNGSSTNMLKNKAFLKEVEHLSFSNKVYCISREEQWLLGLYDIASDYLPYYPSPAIERPLLEVREHRKKSAKRNFLILGSVINRPTLLGTLELISYLEKSKTSEHFDILGFGTHKLARKRHSDQFTIHGEVSTKFLFQQLAVCKAVIIHQPPTTGALTRITEMLVAGIPVICNNNAARTFQNINGISIYEDWDELRRLLKSELDQPHLPTSFLDYEKKFIRDIKSFKRRNS